MNFIYCKTKKLLLYLSMWKKLRALRNIWLKGFIWILSGDFFLVLKIKTTKFNKPKQRSETVVKTSMQKQNRFTHISLPLSLFNHAKLFDNNSLWLVDERNWWIAYFFKCWILCYAFCIIQVQSIIFLWERRKYNQVGEALTK